MRRYSLPPASTDPLARWSAMCFLTSAAAFSVTVSGGAAGASFSPRPCVSVAVLMTMSPFVGTGFVREYRSRVGSLHDSAADRGRLARLGGVLRLLVLVVLDRRLDRVLGQHRAVDLDRR